MKKLLQHLLVGIALISFLPSNATQLSGNYTIDSAGTPSTTVFKDFNSAVIYMTSTGTRPDAGPANSGTVGVSGPVVFLIAQGTYTEQVNIPAITGASATNTITFDGGLGNADTRILEYTATSTTNAHTLRFNGATYVTVMNITVKSNGTAAGVGIHFYSTISTSFITIKRCSVIVSNTTSGTTSAGPIKAIMATNSNISSTGGGTTGAAGLVFNIYIDSNYISGGNFGIFLSSSNATSIPHNFYVRWNSIFNSYNEGIGASTSQGYRIEGNYIKLLANSHTASAGMEHTNGSTSGTHSYVVMNNIIENAHQYGIWFRSNNANSNTLYPTMVLNNYMLPTFTSATSYGINCSQARNHKFIGNTILMNMPGGYGIYSTGSQSPPPVALNNIIQLIGANSTGLCISADAGNIDSCDYNVYTKNSTSADLIKVQGTTYTKVNFIGGGGRNLNSSMDDPLLISLADPRPRNSCQKGLAHGHVMATVDVLGNSRGNPPQIGAAEPAGGSPLDASIVSFLLPQSYPVSSGMQDVKVIIKNAGGITLTSLSVSLELGLQFRNVSWSGSLPTCAIDTVTFTSSNQVLFSAGSNTLKAWVSYPNYLVDSNATNDTIVKTFCTPINAGTYVIDTSGLGDFRSFTQVVDVLNCGGISGTGPVTFLAKTCDYNEQIAIGSVMGVSATSPITFGSFDYHPDSVKLTFNSQASNNYILKLDGASYIKFKNISLIAQNTTNGRVLELVGAASYDTIENCKMISPAAFSTAATNIVVNANPLAGSFNALKNNYIEGGSYAIYWYGSSATLQTFNNLFENNTITDFYYMGMYLYYSTNTKIIGNILNSNSTYTTLYGIYTVYGDSALEIRNNKVVLSPSTTRYGIYLSTCRGTVTSGASISNNTVSIYGSTGTTYGLYATSISFAKFYNNSINISSTSTSSYAAYFSFTSVSYANNIIRNNVFQNLGAGYSVYYANSLYHTTDFNDLYSNGTLLVQTATPAATFSSLPLWKAANSGDANSISYQAGFVSNTDLAPNPADSMCWAMNGRGIHLPDNAFDLNGNPRPITVQAGIPDLGAYEFTPTALPPQAIFVPAVPVWGTTQSILFGTDTIAKIAWDQYYAVPSSIEARFYSGEKPPSIGGATSYMNAYWGIDASTGYYNYNLTLYYKDAWIGTNPNETDMKVAQKSGTLPWVVYLGTLTSNDTVANQMTANWLSSFSYFTGTDNNNPLPVKLIAFDAKLKSNDVLLSWATASERNNNRFEIERSYDNRTFEYAGYVKSNGNTNNLSNYRFTDVDAFNHTSATVIYYRLKTIDNDGSFDYSRSVRVAKENQREIEEISVYPNPFNSELYLKVENSQEVIGQITIIDVQGRKILDAKSFNLSEGTNILKIEESELLTAGVYFIEIKTGEKTQTIKLIKK